MSIDKLAGIYVYCMDYHSGQWSREYRILSRIVGQYKLRLTDSAIRQISEPIDEECEWIEAAEVYQTLVANHQSV